ncbi:glycerol-3-phosphate 1-O-acyltransferase PlsY [Candidatus Palauibacter sp.]|uniref:glycerol-3-phosphate 1-O-acyltransferase PlsY n=1 Tax=Candidatus Palauibacter sp. TaxID=3101350 RepID=UPI003B02CE0A
MTAPLLTLFAYLTGAFPTSYLMGRVYGYDLRREGSGNLGSTNVYRILGFFPAVVVLLVDLLKGFLPVWFFPLWDGRTGAWALAYGLAAITGHVWPVYTKFKGGKGVATAAGTMAALAPVAVTVAFSVWVMTVILTRTASVASLVSASLVPIMARASAAPRSVVSYAILLAVTVWWTHRANLARIVRREELQIDWRRGRVRPRGRDRRQDRRDET